MRNNGGCPHSVRLFDLEISNNILFVISRRQHCKTLVPNARVTLIIPI